MCGEVDTPDAISAAFTIVDELTQEHCLVTTEMVPTAFTQKDTAHGDGTGLADDDF